MQIYLKTAGSRQEDEYRFLNGAPATRWWSEYDTYTDFDRPTALVRGERMGWKMMLAGIPSGRRDRAGREITISLVIQGTQDEGQRGYDLVSSWISDLQITMSGGDGKSEFRDALTTIINGECVDHWFNQLSRGENISDEVDTALNRFVEAIGSAKPVGARAPVSAWWAGLSSESAIQAWLSTTDECLNGNSHSAAILNLAAEKHVVDLFRIRRGAYLLSRSSASITKENLSYSLVIWLLVGFLTLGLGFLFCKRPSSRVH